MFFRTSNFKSLPKESVGVVALRTRLSELLYGHVRRELPKLGHDLEAALHETQKDLELLGVPRPNSTEECKAYLIQLSFDYYNLCKAAVRGDYEGSFFNLSSDDDFSFQSSTAAVRLRALVQLMHTNFAETFSKSGKKYQISPPDDVSTRYTSAEPSDVGLTKLSWEEAVEWVRKVLVRTRGREPVGNLNPLLMAELFWEQSSGWKALAYNHVEEILQACEKFLKILLNNKAPKDVQSRLWSWKISDALKNRRRAAFHELDRIMEDNKRFPITSDPNYTNDVFRHRQERQKNLLLNALESGNTKEVVGIFLGEADPDIEKSSCEDALCHLDVLYNVGLPPTRLCIYHHLLILPRYV